MIRCRAAPIPTGVRGASPGDRPPRTRRCAACPRTSGRGFLNRSPASCGTPDLKVGPIGPNRQSPIANRQLLLVFPVLVLVLVLALVLALVFLLVFVLLA